MDFTFDEKGISGWLSPNGEFISVDYGKHDFVASLLEEQGLVESSLPAQGERLFELMGYIKFVCKNVGTRETQSYVFFPQ